MTWIDMYIPFHVSDGILLKNVLKYVFMIAGIHSSSS